MRQELAGLHEIIAIVAGGGGFLIRHYILSDFELVITFKSKEKNTAKKEKP